ncbi:MAG: hypothetical protein LBE04_03350, partial [Prevotellaceae bacterium]|nr:hypothetical protein [Prevotellaceae bacterium]
AGLCVRLAVYVRMDNRNAVDYVTVIKETDVCIVNCEYHNQNATDKTSFIYFLYHSTTNFIGAKIILIIELT